MRHYWSVYINHWMLAWQLEQTSHVTMYQNISLCFSLWPLVILRHPSGKLYCRSLAKACRWGWEASDFCPAPWTLQCYTMQVVYSWPSMPSREGMSFWSQRSTSSATTWQPTFWFSITWTFGWWRYGGSIDWIGWGNPHLRVRYRYPSHSEECSRSRNWERHWSLSDKDAYRSMSDVEEGRKRAHPVGPKCRSLCVQCEHVWPAACKKCCMGLNFQESKPCQRVKQNQTGWEWRAWHAFVRHLGLVGLSDFLALHSWH